MSISSAASWLCTTTVPLHDLPRRPASVIETIERGLVSSAVLTAAAASARLSAHTRPPSRRRRANSIDQGAEDGSDAVVENVWSAAGSIGDSLLAALRHCGMLAPSLAHALTAMHTYLTALLTPPPRVYLHPRARIRACESGAREAHDAARNVIDTEPYNSDPRMHALLAQAAFQLYLARTEAAFGEEGDTIAARVGSKRRRQRRRSSVSGGGGSSSSAGHAALMAGSDDEHEEVARQLHSRLSRMAGSGGGGATAGNASDSEDAYSSGGGGGSGVDDAAPLIRAEACVITSPVQLVVYDVGGPSRWGDSDAVTAALLQEAETHFRKAASLFAAAPLLAPGALGQDAALPPPVEPRLNALDCTVPDVGGLSDTDSSSDDSHSSEDATPRPKRVRIARTDREREARKAAARAARDGPPAVTWRGTLCRRRRGRVLQIPYAVAVAGAWTEPATCASLPASCCEAAVAAVLGLSCVLWERQARRTALSACRKYIRHAFAVAAAFSSMDTAQKTGVLVRVDGTERSRCTWLDVLYLLPDLARSELVPFLHDAVGITAVPGQDMPLAAGTRDAHPVLQAPSFLPPAPRAPVIDASIGCWVPPPPGLCDVALHMASLYHAWHTQDPRLLLPAGHRRHALSRHESFDGDEADAESDEEAPSLLHARAHHGHAEHHRTSAAHAHAHGRARSASVAAPGWLEAVNDADAACASLRAAAARTLRLVPTTRGPRMSSGCESAGEEDTDGSSPSSRSGGSNVDTDTAVELRSPAHVAQPASQEEAMQPRVHARPLARIPVDAPPPLSMLEFGHCLLIAFMHDPTNALVMHQLSLILELCATVSGEHAPSMNAKAQHELQYVQASAAWIAALVECRLMDAVV